MFTERQLERYADVLLWGLKTARTGRFKKGDIVLIRFDKPAIRLAEILYAKLLDRGINPVPRMSHTSTMELDFYKLSNSKQLVFTPPGDASLSKSLNGGIFLHAGKSRR